MQTRKSAAQWGELAPAGMRYSLTSGVVPGAAGSYCTQAFRAIQFHKFVEPGKAYSIALQVQLDTGSPGGVAAATNWAHDGYVKLWVSEDGGPAELISSFVDSSGGGTGRASRLAHPSIGLVRIGSPAVPARQDSGSS